MNLAYGIAAALFRRERTGEASIVDVSLLASAVWTLSSDILSTTIASTPPDPGIKPNRQLGGYRTKDGRLITVQILNEAHWPGWVHAIGRDDLTEDRALFDTRGADGAHGRVRGGGGGDVRRPNLRRVVRRAPRLVNPVGARAVSKRGRRDPQVVANDYLAKLETEDGVPYTVANAPVEFDETPTRPRHAPSAGQHTEEVMLELGLTWDEIIELKLAEILA